MQLADTESTSGVCNSVHFPGNFFLLLTFSFSFVIKTKRYARKLN